MSVSGNATGVRFGVATSTNRPATPFDGQVISETDTDRLVVYNGSAWGSYGGLQFIKSQTIGSGVSSVEVTGAFSSTYDTYLITINGGAGSAGADLRLKLGASATGYYAIRLGLVYATAATSFGSDNNAVQWTATGTVQTSGLYAAVTLSNPFLAKPTYGTCGYVGSDVTGSALSMMEHRVSTSYTDFTFTPSTGTITGGTIRVYGYLNS